MCLQGGNFFDVEPTDKLVLQTHDSANNKHLCKVARIAMFSQCAHPSSCKGHNCGSCILFSAWMKKLKD